MPFGDMENERGRSSGVGRGRSDMERDRGRPSGVGGGRSRGERGPNRSRSRDGGQRSDRILLPETPDSPATRNPQQTPDPAPKSAEQIAADRVAMLAEVRRRGRGQTVIGASRRLGEAVGPIISRPTLG